MVVGDCGELCKIFPINRIGLATYFLAFVYLLLSWNSFQRLARVRLFSVRWTTHKMLHWFLFCFAVVRAVLFGIISAFSLASQIGNAATDKNTAVLVILFVFPEFLFISAYVLLFFNWLEMYIFCHEQYLFELRPFQKIWKAIFTLVNLALVAVQIVFYVELYVADAKAIKLTTINYIIMYANFLLPAVFVLAGLYFHFIAIAGFQYSSNLSNSRVRKISKVFFWWTGCRIIRALALLLFNVDQNFDTSTTPLNIDFFSILIVASILTAEVVPFNLLMDWATISLLLLSDEREAYGPQNVGDGDMLLGSPTARNGDLESSQWIIDPSELQVSALGMASNGSNDFCTTVVGSWRDSQVTVTMFRTSVDMETAILEELSDEIAELNNCDHGHIAKFYGHCVVGSTVYVVYEYLRRGSLYDFISQQNAKAFPTSFVVEKCKQICEAMAYLHDSRPPRIHGGLSSKSIMLDDDMGVCVINIGLNRLKTYSEVLMVTRIDTPWSSPEQIAGKSLSPASDVYSFGIILWELCTREEPYPNSDQSSNFFRNVVLKKQGRPQINLVQNQEFVEIITQCWSQHPENRPTFNEISRMLDDIKTDK